MGGRGEIPKILRKSKVSVGVQSRNCQKVKAKIHLSTTHTDSTVTSSSETTIGWEKAVMPSREAEGRPSSLQGEKRKTRTDLVQTPAAKIGRGMAQRKKLASKKKG